MDSLQIPEATKRTAIGKTKTNGRAEEVRLLKYDCEKHRAALDDAVFYLKNAALVDGSMSAFMGLEALEEVLDLQDEVAPPER